MPFYCNQSMGGSWVDYFFVSRLMQVAFKLLQSESQKVQAHYRRNRMLDPILPCCPLHYSKRLHCAAVVFWSFLHNISLSTTDYWETRQAFNLLTRPILYLSTLFHPSLCFLLTHTQAHIHFLEYSPVPRGCGSTSAHWLTASFPPLTRSVL